MSNIEHLYSDTLIKCNSHNCDEMLNFNACLIVHSISDIFFYSKIFTVRARNEDVPSLFLQMNIMLNQDKLQRFSLYAYI